MRVEPRTEDPSINIVTRNGVAIGEDKSEGKIFVTNVGVQRAPEKRNGLIYKGRRKPLS